MQKLHCCLFCVEAILYFFNHVIGMTVPLSIFKNATSQMFDRVLNTPLKHKVLISKNSMIGEDTPRR